MIASTLSPAGATDPNGAAHSAAVPTNVTEVQAAADGTFSASLPSPAGTWVITAASLTRTGATGYAQVTIAATQ